MKNNDNIDYLIVFLIFNFLFFISACLAKYTDEDELLLDSSKIDDEIKKDEKEEVNTKKSNIPYEEKYLLEVRNMENEYVFSEEELKKEEQKFYDLLEENKNSIQKEINQLKMDIDDHNNKLNELNELNALGENNKDLENKIKSEISILSMKLKNLEDGELDIDALKEQARQFIIDEQLVKYKNNFIMEKTPLGNVLMFYNHSRLTFDYYSDLTIPYRFLETVARKYVLTFNYRPLYIDMEEELKKYEKKLEEQKQKEIEILSSVKENSLDNNTNNNKKKDVFAKFKSYNKEAGTGKVGKVPPPKNSIPANKINVNLNNNEKSDKILLKERSNRFSHQGKFANFNILQKIDRKKVDKKYAMTFAEFKKQILNNK